MSAPMEPARWKLLEPLLDQALELHPSDRIAYLGRVQTADPEAYAELEALLRWCERPDGFLEHPLDRGAASLLLDSSTGQPLKGLSVGPFRIVQELGHGGMGAVYLAERADGHFEQRVALKLIRGVFSPGDYLVRRFLEERRILASLEHPGIARLIDGGVTPDGCPWFAMELVEGRRIDRHSDERRLPIEHRLRLFLEVCDAVQYAHRNLVVHRDLKPSNILVTGTGSIKLLDFGIARLVSPRDDGATESTVRALTPDYASPEQIRGEPLTTATDVYSLGVILYEQLSGERPYRSTGRSAFEIERAVSAHEIAPPSSAAARVDYAVAARRATTPERLARRLRGDLDTIVLAALRVEPERRYGSAEQLARDIRRHLEGRAVSARRDTIGYRSARFIGRHRIAVAAAGVIVALLIGATVVTQVQARRIARERDKAEALSGFMMDLFAAPDPWYGGGASLTVRELLDSSAARISRELSRQPEMRADLLNMMGRSYQGFGLLDQSRAILESALVASRRTGSDVRIARDLMWLGNLASDREDFAAAESLSRSALARQRRSVPEGSPELMPQLIFLAEVLRKTGRLDEAESLVLEALAIARRQRPEAPLRVALMLNDMGHVLRDRGDLAGAAARYREALELRRTTLGPDHPDVANLELNLARVQHRLGDTSAAGVMRRAIDRKRRGFGDDHPEIAWDRAELAAVLEDRGAVAEADSLYQAALAVQRRSLPPGHTRTATTLLGLGRVLLARGDSANARALIAESLAIYQRAAWRDQRRIAEAEELLRGLRTSSRP